MGPLCKTDVNEHLPAQGGYSRSPHAVTGSTLEVLSGHKTDLNWLECIATHTHTHKVRSEAYLLICRLRTPRYHAVASPATAGDGGKGSLPGNLIAVEKECRSHLCNVDSQGLLTGPRHAIMYVTIGGIGFYVDCVFLRDSCGMFFC